MKRFFIAIALISMAICYRESELIYVYTQYQIEKMELRSMYDYSRDLEKANKSGANISQYKWEQLKNDIRLQKGIIGELKHKLGVISGNKN